MVNKHLLTSLLFGLVFLLWVNTSPVSAQAGNCPTGTYEFAWPAPVGFSPSSSRLCDTVELSTWSRLVNETTFPCQDTIVFNHPFLLGGSTHEVYIVPPASFVYPSNRAKLQFFTNSRGGLINLTPATRSILTLRSYDFSGGLLATYTLDSLDMVSRASSYHILWEMKAEDVIAQQGGYFSLQFVEPSYWAGTGYSYISNLMIQPDEADYFDFCSVPEEVIATATPEPNQTLTTTPNPSEPTATATPLPSGPTPTPIPATTTPTPTRTPNPNQTPPPTLTPWPTSEGGTPTVFPQATGYVAITATPGGSGGSGGVATPPPIPTFSQFGLPSWDDINFATVPPSTPWPTLTPRATLLPWPTFPPFSIGTPVPAGTATITATNGLGLPGEIMSQSTGLVSQGYAVATRWAEPVDAAFGQLLATDTVTGPATFSIVGVGQQVEYMVDTVVEPFQLARALVYYMPNTWPLAGAFMTVIFVVTANMVWRFSLNVIVTSFELFRRLWGMLPFT